MEDLPWTPDYDHYRIDIPIQKAVAYSSYVSVMWEDGKESQYDVFLLRENSPDPETIHAQSREMLISPLDLPADLSVDSACVGSNGALEVVWSTGEKSAFHPGWLRQWAWFEGEDPNSTTSLMRERFLWKGNDLREPPTFDGGEVLADESKQLAWLEALHRYGVARLRGLENQDGLLEQVVRKVGVPRETNFGAKYVLEIKDNPDSNAFTSGALLQHMDMPTRESPHGLQFLFCRKNSTEGGEGVYVDGFHVANVLRDQEPCVFEILRETSWVFNNRSRSSDFRAVGPVIKLDANDELSEIRLTTWLRAPLKAPLQTQQKAYRAIRTLTRYLQDPSYQLTFRYEPGDLLAFDNRRVLHGRRAYAANSGERFIEGIYADRDDLYSKIRVLRRSMS